MLILSSIVHIYIYSAGYIQRSGTRTTRLAVFVKHLMYDQITVGIIIIIIPLNKNFSIKRYYIRVNENASSLFYGSLY